MSDSGLLEAVLQRYDLWPDALAPAGGTAGRTWRVTCGARSYFVRRRGARTASPARIAFDHGLRRHLAAHGFPAVPPLTTIEGETCVTLDGGVYEVYPWVEGRGLGPDIARPACLAAATTLARFHRIAATYAAPCERLLPQFGHYPTPLPQAPRFDDPEVFLAVADFLADRYRTAGNREAMARARAWIEGYAEWYGALQRRLPLRVIHGDYNGCNLLFNAVGQVVGVFDYDWAWRDTRVRDVGEGVFFFGARRERAPDGGDIWSLTACPRLETAAMAEFLSAYHRAAPLSDTELQAVPLAMLGRWIACRTEGAMKVPEEQRAAFYLADFARPFEWYEREAHTLVSMAAGWR